MQKSIESRNREAIQNLVTRESNRDWAKNSPDTIMPKREHLEYLKHLGRNYKSLAGK